MVVIVSVPHQAALKPFVCIFTGICKRKKKKRKNIQYVLFVLSGNIRVDRIYALA